MNNFLGSGETLTAPAPSGGVVGGTPYLLGSLLVVATTTAAAGVLTAFKVTGEVRYTKAGSQAWTVGAKVYWDNSAKVFTLTADGNTLVGVAVEAVADGASDTTGKVRLDGVAR